MTNSVEETLRAALRAAEGPTAEALAPWVALARDSDGEDEFWERVAVAHHRPLEWLLRDERLFYAGSHTCPRCGERAPALPEQRPAVLWSGRPTDRSELARCRACSLARRTEPVSAGRPTCWAHLVLFAARAERLEDGERLALQVNRALEGFGEAQGSVVQWRVGLDGCESAFNDARTVELNRAVSAGRKRSGANPILVTDAVVARGPLAAQALDVARDLVAADGWSNATQETPERTAFDALRALYLAGIVYEGARSGVVTVRVAWALDEDTRRVLPREIPVW